jgi:hypothetical protein
VCVCVRVECERPEPVAVGDPESQHLQRAHAALFPPWGASQWQVELLPAGGARG